MNGDILVAGIGNIFLTDDGFGPEVMRHLAGTALPDGFSAVDFGIRGVHLAYQLLDGYDVLVIVDAAPRDLAPGTVSVFEVDPRSVGGPGDGPLLDAHGMEPVAVLRTLGSLGGDIAQVYVVACEPADVGEGLGLSPAVAAAVPGALAALRQLIDELAEQFDVTSSREVTR